MWLPSLVDGMCLASLCLLLNFTPFSILGCSGLISKMAGGNYFVLLFCSWFPFQVCDDRGIWTRFSFIGGCGWCLRRDLKTGSPLSSRLSSTGAEFPGGCHCAWVCVSDSLHFAFYFCCFCDPHSPPPDFLFNWFIFLIKSIFFPYYSPPQASCLVTWKLYNRILLSAISFEFSSDGLDLREQKVSEHPSPVCSCTRTRALPGHTVPAFAGAEVLWVWPLLLLRLECHCFTAEALGSASRVQVQLHTPPL